MRLSDWSKLWILDNWASGFRTMFEIQTPWNPNDDLSKIQFSKVHCSSKKKTPESWRVEFYLCFAFDKNSRINFYKVFASFVFGLIWECLIWGILNLGLSQSETKLSLFLFLSTKSIRKKSITGWGRLVQWETVRFVIISSSASEGSKHAVCQVFFKCNLSRFVYVFCTDAWHRGFEKCRNDLATSIIGTRNCCCRHPTSEWKGNIAQPN